MNFLNKTSCVVAAEPKTKEESESLRISARRGDMMGFEPERTRVNFSIETSASG